MNSDQAGAVFWLGMTIAAAGCGWFVSAIALLFNCVCFYLLVTGKIFSFTPSDESEKDRPKT